MGATSIRRIFRIRDNTEKRRSSNLASFQKLCPGIETAKKDELFVLGQPLNPKSQADLMEKKSNEQKKVNGIVEKLDVHYRDSSIRRTRIILASLVRRNGMNWSIGQSNSRIQKFDNVVSYVHILLVP